MRIKPGWAPSKRPTEPVRRCDWQALAEFLRSLNPDVRTVVISLEEISWRICKPLPPAAHRPSFWNPWTAWLHPDFPTSIFWNCGFRPAGLDRKSGHVLFRRA
jgi:hypothetical protein